MSSKVKVLGLALVAMFAMSAMVAAAAQAHKFNAAKSPAVLTGTNEAGTKDAFTIVPNGATVKCGDSKFEATSKVPAETLTVHPTYSECEFNGSPATVNTNHCAYVFSGETQEFTVGQLHAHVDVECAEGSSITIEVPSLGIVMHVFAQTGTKDGVVYTNIKETVEGKEVEAVTVNSTVKNIITKCTGFGCVFIGGENLVGEYNGVATVTGYEDTGSAKSGTETTTPAPTSHSVAPINATVE